MKCAGTAKIDDEEYILMVHYQRVVTYFYLFSKYHRDDQQHLIFGDELNYPVREIVSYSIVPVDNNYIVSAIMKKNIGGELKAFGAYHLLLKIIDAMQTSISYAFRPQDVLLDDTSQFGSKMEPIRDFMASDDTIKINYRKIGGFLAGLEYNDALLSIKFSEESGYFYPEFKKILPLLNDIKPEDAGAKAYYSNIDSVDYNTVLRKMEDYSWYVQLKSDGTEVYHKDYQEVCSEEDFEHKIIMSLVNGIKECRRNNTLPLLVSVDTETTGLDVFGIPSKFQSKVVAIPFSCKDHTGFTIFIGMEYFNNLSVNYVRDKLGVFLHKDLLEDPDITVETVEGSFVFKRSEIFVTGHNTLFDIKALLVHDIPIWYDADTLQMSFNLDPFLTKRKNSLKYITRKLFGCCTPELADILGKGNEDKFRFITDVKIARLYGGADADFSRLVFKSLRKIYQASENFHKTDLFKAYQNQDVIPMNMVSRFDFSGIRIDRKNFVQEGERVKSDIAIITDFAHKYVGRIIAANNYLRQRKVIIDSNTEIENNIALLEENYKGNIGAIEGTIAEMRSWIKDPESIPKPDLDKAPPYYFKFSGQDLIHTLYEVLNYPVLVWTQPPKPKSDGSNQKISKPRPAVNKAAMKKLISKKSKSGEGLLKADVIGANGKSLIVAEEFNKLSYPVAYLVSLIGPRKKEYDAYFAAFAEASYGERLCKDSRFASIDTRRVSNPIQTIKGSLKKYLLPLDDTYAMCDFDMSQVELRIMASLAHDEYTIEKMKDPEIDSHTECASDMSVGVSKIYKAAYLINKWERNNAKAVNFGYPYGLQRHSMCERIFGDDSPEHLAQTQRIIEAFERAKAKIVTFLNKVRKQTLKPVGFCEEEDVPIPDILRNYLEIGESVPIGVVRNLKGFYKLFQLDDMTDKKAARIGRQAGNFPIQSFAAELFRIILIRLFKEFWRIGWIQNGWIKGHMLVHDEFLFSFKKRLIHPVHLVCVLHKCCTVRIVNHTNYYIGINIGNNWGECKDDMSELPVLCVERLKQRWESGDFEGEVVDDPKKYMSDIRQRYISDRIFEVISFACPEFSKSRVSCAEVLKKFENYTVRKYIYECYKYLWTPNKNEQGHIDENDVFDAKFATWVLERFGDDTVFITSNNKEVILHNNLKNMTKIADDKIVPYSFEEMFEGKVVSLDDFLDSVDLNIDTVEQNESEYYKTAEWDLDGNSPYYINYDYDENLDVQEGFNDVFDTAKGVTLEAMRKVTPTVFGYIQFVGNRVKIDLRRKNHAILIEAAIASANIKNGDIQIWYSYGLSHIKGSCVNKEDLNKLDKIVYEVRR